MVCTEDEDGGGLVVALVGGLRTNRREPVGLTVAATVCCAKQSPHTHGQGD